MAASWFERFELNRYYKFQVLAKPDPTKIITNPTTFYCVFQLLETRKQTSKRHNKKKNKKAQWGTHYTHEGM